MPDITHELQFHLDRCLDRRFTPPRIRRVNAKHVPVRLIEEALSEIISLRIQLKEAQRERQ